MFEVGWTEMLVIAIVMIVVVGPKDLPNMLRTFGRTTAKLRAMASDFQKQFNEALKEAELDDVKKSVDELRGLSPAAEIRKQLNPFEKAAADVRAGVDAAMKPKPAADPTTSAASTPLPAEPLKNGATEMPGVSGPEDVAAAVPVFPAMTDESVMTSSLSAGAVPSPKPSAAKRSSKGISTKPASAAPANASPAVVNASSPMKAPDAKAKAASRASAKAGTAAKPELPKVARPAAVKKGAAMPSAASESQPAQPEEPAATKTAGAAK
ncbi:Sec-independent protein translocase protein TatB [Mesorhizobium sp. ES1-1]|uniref:Sec-independent protein translocase protein TatB n=1 Tax=Mesorhizobium sp. ES1-1 TaxID=2876629 RepID=UPI001CCB4B70|nr:Sec-independent protein translocase protein TatB [Mesorhizobium sp. ES1-1]MBZ9677229.1 Sec-independent protein translocase protein TatB [Mesorhizobium sp. ES1-1]